MPSDFIIRRADLEDVPAIARHRVAMFAEMGDLPPGHDQEAGELFRAASRFLAGAIPSGEYVGWLAAPSMDPTDIIAGAGVQIRRTMPRALLEGGVPRITEGRQAIVLNVFTEPPWRRKGVARLLMLQVIGWAGEAGMDSLVLHASQDGRALYESLGFTPTNEMRWRSVLGKTPGS